MEAVAGELDKIAQTEKEAWDEYLVACRDTSSVSFYEDREKTAWRTLRRRLRSVQIERERLTG